MEVLLDVNPSSEAALHRQVYEAVRSAILSGRLKAGDRVPPTRALAEQLSLSRTTVTEAYDQLQAEGYLQGKHGSGTYVAPNLPEEGLETPAKRVRGPHVAKTAPQLSDWGQRIIREDYSALFRPPAAATFQYDFRPHRVAQDAFPWNSWRAATDDALAANRDNLLSYPPSAGHPELREAIADHVGRHRAVVCSPEHVVIVNGSQQGLNLLSHLLLESGDGVAVEDPGYPTARLAFEARGVRVQRVPVDENGMVVDLLGGDDLRMVHVTASHQEPTGATLSLGRRLALLERAEQSRFFIVEDDYDSEFRYEGRPVESLQGLDRNELVIYAGTFSKSVLPGLRTGFLILPRPLVSPFVAAKSVWDRGAPMLEQTVLSQFIRSGDFERHIRRMRRLYRVRRDALVEALCRTFGDRAAVGDRHGGLNILVSLHVKIPEAQLVARAAKAGIGLRAATPYYSTPPAVPTFLIGFAALAPEDSREGIRLLADIADAA